LSENRTLTNIASGKAKETFSSYTKWSLLLPKIDFAIKIRSLFVSHPFSSWMMFLFCY